MINHLNSNLSFYSFIELSKGKSTEPRHTIIVAGRIFILTARVVRISDSQHNDSIAHHEIFLMPAAIMFRDLKIC